LQEATVNFIINEPEDWNLLQNNISLLETRPNLEVQYAINTCSLASVERIHSIFQPISGAIYCEYKDNYNTTRNQMVKHASYSDLIFLDEDVVIDEAFVALTDALSAQTPNWCASFNPVSDCSGSTTGIIAEQEHCFMHPKVRRQILRDSGLCNKKHSSSSEFSGVCFGLKREVLSNIGGFDERYGTKGILSRDIGKLVLGSGTQLTRHSYVNLVVHLNQYPPVNQFQNLVGDCNLYFRKWGGVAQRCWGC